MSIDLSKLSAKELFELAQQKEKEEQEAAERQGKVDELKKKLEDIVTEHKNALLLTDKKIRDMQEQREKLIKDHEAALGKLEKEIKELGGATPKTQPASGSDTRDTAPKTESSSNGEPSRASPKAESSSGGETNSNLKSTIRQIMNKRPYISASLLKEKLAGYGIKPANFNKDLEQWVKNDWLTSKGKGNYALGKKA